MPARTSGNAQPEQQSESADLMQQHVGVIGNERLTALVSLLLLMLIIVELVTAAFLHIWLPAHTVVGVLLAGPLLVKMSATGWRFLRYYTRAPAYVRRGPPPLVLRVLGPVLLITTVVMVGSGIGLVVTGPLQPLLLTHVFSALLWLPLIAVHSLAHILQAPQSIASDWSSRQDSRFPVGRVLRLGTNLGALVLGVIGAWLLTAIETPGKGGRRRQYLTLEEEQEFLAPFFAQAERGEIATVEQIWHAFEQRVGHHVDDSTIYRLLHRHGWPKLMPRPRHPKSDLETQEQFKKTFPPRWMRQLPQKRWAMNVLCSSWRKTEAVLTQNGFDGWAVLEWEDCIKDSEQGAREGAAFIRSMLIDVPTRAFDDFAGGAQDIETNYRILGLQP